MYVTIGYIIIGLGLLLMIIGLIGLFKFNNFYSRILISSIIDSASFITIIIGIIFIKGFTFFSLKILLVLLLMMFLNPLATHTIVRGAYTSGFRIGDDS
ncbi:MAG: monovalent cation/H(+) antiporter subunit G [Vallitalea sp.]|jgi:multicomponent Na+:H+ antiporter subunit G|nr:monovalent cation/H(+) antiporter subunit G [Vallitalea sp.]